MAEYKMITENSPATSRAAAAATLLPVPAILLTLSGLTLTATLISLAAIFPLFLLFSPILLLATGLIGLALFGFFTSGSIAGSVLSSENWKNIKETMAKTGKWILNNMKRTMADAAKDAGYEILEDTKNVIAEKAGDVKQRISEKLPSISQVVTGATLFSISGILLVLSVLTFTTTVIGLTATFPLFLLFSPVIVPAAGLIGLALAGFFASEAMGVMGVSWVAGVAGRVFSRERLATVAGKVGQRTKDVGQGIQSRAYDVRRAT